MACRRVWLVAAACALIGTAAGCRRSPLADDRDGSAGDTSGTPSRGDGAPEWPDAPLDTGVDSGREVAPSGGDAADPVSDAGEVRDATPEMIEDALSDAPVDAPTDVTADAPIEVPADAPVDAPADAPEETGGADAPTDGSPPDLADGGGSDVRPEDQPCGPSGWHCNPFACDVALGICKSACATNDDCFARVPCTQGTCGRPGFGAPCTSNADCNSGFCAQGACCQTACSGTCMSCAVLGSIGVCSFVPSGTSNPSCAAGSVCDGRGQCVPTTCTAATDCGRYHSCSGGHCIPCVATCASTPDCAAGAICIDNNGCTTCDRPDAGTP